MSLGGAETTICVTSAKASSGAGNSYALAPAAEALLRDPAPVVRGMAVWALSRLASAERMHHLHAAHSITEPDPDVRAEWETLSP